MLGPRYLSSTSMIFSMWYGITIQFRCVHLFILATLFNPSVAVASKAVTVPHRVSNAEEAKVTQAPKLRRRQESINYCTEWSYSYLSPAGCFAPNTCLFTSVSSSFGVAYCGVAGSSYEYATACSDYTALTTEPSYETLHCGSTLPYCHTLNFISDTSDTYTMFGCDNWKATAIGVALPTAGAVITTQSSPVSSGSPQRTTSGLTGISPSATSTQTSPLTAPVSTTSVPSGVNMAAAIGGALGGFASVVVAVLAVYKFWSKKNKSKEPLNP